MQTEKHDENQQVSLDTFPKSGKSGGSGEKKEPGKENIPYTNGNLSDESSSASSEGIGDTTDTTKDGDSNENSLEGSPEESVELVTRSLFFDSIPKRKYKRKKSRMKRYFLKKAATACRSSNGNLKPNDSSSITIKAIHINWKDASISSTFTSENSFEHQKKFDDKSHKITCERLMSSSHPFYNSTTMLTELSKCIAEDRKYDDAYQTFTDKGRSEKNSSEDKDLNDSTNKEFLASLPSQFLPFIGENPSLFEYMPMTLEKAVDLSSKARLITEAVSPFRIIHVNSEFLKLGGNVTSCSVIGKPLAELKENSFLESFLSSLGDKNKCRELPEKNENSTQGSFYNSYTQMETGCPTSLPKCFIKLVLIGKGENASSPYYSHNMSQVTHFLTQIETDSGIMRKSGLHAHAIG